VSYLGLVMAEGRKVKAAWGRVGQDITTMREKVAELVEWGGGGRKTPRKRRDRSINKKLGD